MSTETDNSELAEMNYERGNRSAWLIMLRECLRQLGYDDPESQKVAWLTEREAAVSTLRAACADHGDNNWPDDLHLADVIEKHLVRHLQS